MSEIHRCSLSELAAAAPTGMTHFILSASYEERAHGVWMGLSNQVKGMSYICYNFNHIGYLRQSVLRMTNGIKNHQLIRLDSDVPRLSFDALKQVFHDIALAPTSHVGLDMTGFTREALAMILFLAREMLPKDTRFTAFYHRAGSYAQDETQGWLSQGVREVRSIMGYPGRMRLSGDTDLVLISGFEIDRAKEIIDTIQPNRILLGKLDADPKDTDDHDAALNSLTERLMGLYAASTVQRFCFNKSDSYATRDLILKAVESSTANIVMASLNSKPAMVGACLAALRNRAIQLVYAQPQCYNIASYSEPSGKVVFFDVRFCD